MSLPSYPAYKASGVEWLGDVPGHWETWKLSHAFGSIGSGTTPPSNERQWYEDGVIPWVTTGELRENVIFETAKSVTAAALEKFTALRVHPAGSLAVAMYGATIGRLGFLGVDATTNQACCVLSSPVFLDTRFVYFWLDGFKQTIINLYATGGGQPNISQDTIASLRIPAPHIEEQQTIAAFLDRETGKIDTLIAEQRRLVELLAEKRQAVISHAVTKGLNPNAPMKDSGIEWLGEVPEHWEVKPLRMIANVVRGASPRPAGDPRYFGGDAVPWVTVGEITKDNSIYLTETETFLTQEGAEHSNLFPTGTVIYSNSGATLGVPKVLHIDACANDGVVAFLNLNSQVTAEFLFHYLASITDSIREKVKQGSGQPNLNTDIVKDLRFGLPPLDEQKLIVQWIAELADQFDTLTAEANRAIELLQERRSALISAAVTGKIDVRATKI